MVSRDYARVQATSRTASPTQIDVPGWWDWEQKRLSDVLTLAAAREAGRAAQVASLESALRSVAPDHHLLAETGLYNADGTRELRWHTTFDAAYDAVAIPNGFTPLRSRARADGMRSAVAADGQQQAPSWFYRLSIRACVDRLRLPADSY